MKLPNEDVLPIIGIHLDVYDETEETRLREIKEVLKLAESFRDRFNCC